MTVEVIHAFGQYIIMPICGAVAFVAFCYYVLNQRD